MKKVMFAAAAIAAGVAMADVTSANIVGYTTTAVDAEGEQIMAGAQFVTVGEGELDLQDIKVEGDNRDCGSSIRWWNSKTRKYSYAYYNMSYYIRPDEDTEYTDKDAWVDGDLWLIDKTFVPGEGFWFTAGKDGAKIVTSGQIDMPTTPKVGFTVDTEGEQIMVINPFPTVIDIQTITVEDDNRDCGSSIRWWNSKTRKYSYAYYNMSYYIRPDEDTEYTDKDAWVDGDLWLIDKTFVPGEGFWFTAGKDGAKIKLVNPFYEAK